MNALVYKYRPLAPAGLEGLDHLIGAGGVVLGAVGVATAPITGAIAAPALFGAAVLGLVGSGLGYRNAIDDENDEHTKYLIHMEIYHRYQNPETRQGIIDTQDEIRLEFEGKNTTDGESENDVEDTEGFSLIQ